MFLFLVPEIIFHFSLKSRLNNVMEHDIRDGTCWGGGLCGALKDKV